MNKLKLKLLKLLKINTYINPSFNKDCEVLIINDKPEDGSIETTLGISKERLNELSGKLTRKIEEMKNTNSYNIPILIAELSKECKHPNELTILAYSVGMIYERSQNPIMKIFRF